MEIKISDSIGNVLILTTNVRGVSFQAVSCSPNPSGFSVLSGLLGHQAGETWDRNACEDSIMRNEVCILPKLRSSDLRILLTPKINSISPGTRLVASRLMFDTFAASQADGIEAKNLLITHFACVRKYPEPQVQGICDEIKSLMNGSFLRLQLLAFDVLDLHLQQFGCQLISEFDGLSEI